MFTLLAAGTAAFWLTIPISVLIVAILGDHRRLLPPDDPRLSERRRQLHRRQGEPRDRAGLVAAAALLVDYVLTVSVSVAAGVAAITSAFPGALERPPRRRSRPRASSRVMLVNLRGIRESGTVFAIPTYVFLVSMLALIAHRHRPDDARRRRRTVTDVTGRRPGRDARPAAADAGVRRRLQRDHRRRGRLERRAGIQAAGGAQRADDARVMGVLVGVMFLGMSWLAGVERRRPEPEHETVISQIGRAVFGTGSPYYVLQLSTMGILILAANTSFADFPRLASLLARDGFMPSRFAFRGERLAFSAGIVALAVLSIVVLAAFGGRVEALIPLYAVGVFTSITLSQAGMVVHWWRDRDAGWRRSIGDQRRRRGRDRHRRADLRGREVRARRVADRHHHPAPRRRDAAHRPPVPSVGGSRPRSARRASSDRRAGTSG